MHHYNNQICDRVVGKIEKWNDACAMERGGTGYLMVGTGKRKLRSTGSHFPVVSMDDIQQSGVYPETVTWPWDTIALGNDGGQR